MDQLSVVVIVDASILHVTSVLVNADNGALKPPPFIALNQFVSSPPEFSEGDLFSPASE